MNFDVDDTIAAIACAPGSSLRGIVRISGPAAVEIIADRQVFEPVVAKNRCTSDIAELNRATTVSGRFVLEPERHIQAQLLIWPDDRSFTRQPSVEIHTLGSPPLLQMILDQLVAHGCRLAEPGEYTMRAFLGGRIDLTQAEAVLGVINSRDRRQFERSLQQLAGGITAPLEAIRMRLLRLLAELEAGLDFVEEDIEFIDSAELRAEISAVEHQLLRLIEQLNSRRDERSSIQVSLVGRPNAGKSSLFNCLAGGNAIVSRVAGTTRDFLQSEVDAGGIAITLIDTAGIDESELEGETASSIGASVQRQTESVIKTADLLLLCVEAGQELSAREQEILDSGLEVLLVRTKGDLCVSDTLEPDVVVTSTVDGSGLEDLRVRIGNMATSLVTSDSGAGPVARTSDALNAACTAIQSAGTAVETSFGEELVAADIRASLDCLGQVTGSIYTDDILDLIFSQFCIGK